MIPSSRTALILPTILLCAAFVYVGSLSSSTGHSIDDGIHIVAAKALATGQGLRMISDPVAPPATQFPPGHSLFLVPVLWLFPDPPDYIIPLQLVSTLFGLCFVGLSWVWFRRQFDLPIAALMTSLVALNPETIRFSGAVIAEMGYAAFVMAAVLFFDHALSQERLARIDRRALFGAAVMMTGAYLFRSVGIGLVMAVVATLALRRRWYAAALVLGGFLVLAAPWLLKSALVGTPEYRNQFWLVSLENPEQGQIGLWGLTGRMSQNAVTYLSVTIPDHLFSLLGSQRIIEGFRHTGLYPALIVARLALSTLLLIGFWRRLRSGVAMIDLYMLAYFAMLLIWHNRIQWKYMAPVTPMLLYYLYTGASWVFSRMPWRLSWSRVSYALLGLLLIGYLLRVPDSLERGWLGAGREDPYAPAYGWLKRETPDSSLIIGFDHLGLFLYTGRKTLAPLMSHDPRSVLQYALDTGAGYMVVQPGGVSNEQVGLDKQYQRPAIKVFPERFSLVFADPVHQIEIYRINRNL